MPTPIVNSLPTVLLFTDGACSGNPGPGGWAFIMRHPSSGKEMERSGGEQQTTNNRMELTAVVRGLEALKKPAFVELFTDSEYVRKGLSEWLAKWKSNGWRRREGKALKEIKNEDLWRELDRLTIVATPKTTAAMSLPSRPINSFSKGNLATRLPFVYRK
jgi:ribonuclease HI